SSPAALPPDVRKGYAFPQSIQLFWRLRLVTPLIYKTSCFRLCRLMYGKGYAFPSAWPKNHEATPHAYYLQRYACSLSHRGSKRPLACLSHRSTQDLNL